MRAIATFATAARYTRAMAQPDFEQLDRVRISAAGVAEMDEHRYAIAIPRAEVLGIELSFGSAAERPIISAILGVSFACVATFLAALIVLAIRDGHVAVPKAAIAGVAFYLPAWWLLDLALRRRFFLRVQTPSGSRKLVFHDRHDAAEVERFVTAARLRFGYPQSSRDRVL